MKKIVLGINSLNIVIFFTFLLLSCFIFYSLSTFYLHGDVLWEGIPLGLGYFIMPIHGRYLGEILERMIGFGNYFGIHPMDYINTFGAFSISLVYSFICYLIASSMYIGRKKDYFFPVFLIIVYLFTLKFGCIESHSWTQFWGYSAQLVFLFLSLNLIIKYFIEQRFSTSKQEIIQNSIIAFFLGMACEYMNIVSLILFFILFLFFVVKSKFDFKQICTNIKEIGKALYLPFSCFFISFFSSYLNPFFWIHAKEDKGIELTSDYIFSSASQLSIVINDFYNILIYNYKYYLLFILILLLFIFFSNKEKKENIHFITINLFIYISVLLFFLILCLLGKSDYNDGESYLYHVGLHLLYKTTLLYILFATIGRLFYIYSSALFIISLLMVYTLFFAFDRSFIDQTLYFYDYLLKSNIIVRQKWYDIDFISCYSLSKSKDVYLPISYVKHLQYTDYFLDDNTFHIPENEIINKYGVFPANEILNSYIYYLQLSYGIPDENITNFYILSDEDAFAKYSEIKNEFTTSETQQVKFAKIKEKYYSN